MTKPKMNNGSWHIITVALSIVVVLTSYNVLTLNKHEKSATDALARQAAILKEVQSENAALRRDVDTLTGDLDALRDALSGVIESVDTLEKDVKEVSDSKAFRAVEVTRATQSAPKPRTPVRTAPVASGGTSEDTIRKVATERGLTDKDTANLIEIARRESTVGKNPVAYEQGRENVGLFQLSSDKGTHAQRADDEWATNKAIDYINKRYGSTDGAIAHSNAKGWY